MELLLRKISSRMRWMSFDDRATWQLDEIAADPLKDLSTSGNTLSVWRINPDKSNLRRVVAAIAATADKVDHFDFILINRKHVDSAGISVQQSAGDSPDAHANTHWHLDLVELTALQLVRLLHGIANDSPVDKIDRILKKELHQLLLAGIDSGQIHRGSMNEKLQRSLGLQ